MGTRSLTFINDGKTRLVCFYRQFDGYPSGHGKELAEFLKPITIVNGFSSGMKTGTHANGAGCLAAQLIKHFKDDIGGIYIQPPNCRDAGQEYEYHVTVDGGNIIITVKSSCWDQACKKIIFKGSPDELLTFCTTPETEDDE